MFSIQFVRNSARVTNRKCLNISIHYSIRIFYMLYSENRLPRPRQRFSTLEPLSPKMECRMPTATLLLLPYKVFKRVLYFNVIIFNQYKTCYIHRIESPSYPKKNVKKNVRIRKLLSKEPFRNGPPPPP